MNENALRLMDEHQDKASAVMEVHMTHTVRMVRVLQDLVALHSQVTQDMMAFEKQPNNTSWRGATRAHALLSFKIDELLEGYRDCSGDKESLIRLIMDALDIVKEVARET